MGWSGGSEIMAEVINAIQLYVRSENTRKCIYHVLICDFQNHDADTLDECQGLDPAFDRVWEEMHDGGDDTP